MTDNKLYGVIITIVFHSILLFLALFLTLNFPDPPPKESAILVTLGDENYAPETPNNQVVTPVSPPVTTAPDPVESKNDPDGEINEKPKPQKPIKNPQKQVTKPITTIPSVVKPPERQVNQQALFKPGNSTNPDKSATQVGDPLGDPSSTSSVGLPDGQKEGASLEGRNLVGNLPKPIYNTQESGKIIIRIYVNKQGEVTKTEFQPKGSTLQNAQLIKMSEEAAMRAKFNNIASKTDNTQIGYITYIFKLN